MKGLETKLCKYVLLVEPGSTELSKLAPELKALGMMVLRAHSPASAAKLLRNAPLLSLVAIDSAIGDADSLAVLSTAKRSHPGLPVIWITRQLEKLPVTDQQETPDRILRRPLDPRALLTEVEELLCERMYPSPIVSLLSESSVTVLASAYSTKVRAGAPHIVANRTALAEINAVLPFCGSRVAGRLVVSGSLEHLLRVRARTIAGSGTASFDAAEDLAGEIGNVLIGRLKALFVRYDLSFELGTPIMLGGGALRVRYRASRPALVIPLEEDDGTIFVTFCFDTFDANRIASTFAEEVPEEVHSGEISFL